jgi:hypothetical protein
VPRRVEPADVVIIEGILVLNMAAIREQLHMKVGEGAGLVSGGRGLGGVAAAAAAAGDLGRRTRSRAAPGGAPVVWAQRPGWALMLQLA